MLLPLLVEATLAKPWSSYSIDNRRAIERYDEAVQDINLGKAAEALNKLDKLAAKYEDFVEPHLAMAYQYELLGDYRRAYSANLRAIAIDSSFYPTAYYDAGRMAFLSQQFDEGERLIQHFLQRAEGVKPAMRRFAQLFLAKCRFARHAYRHPHDIRPTPLPPEVNTRLDEYFPSLSADSRTLCFTRLLPKEGTSGQGRQNMQEDLFLARRGEAKEAWRAARNIGPPVSTPENEGSQALAADGNEMYISKCYGPCQIFYARRDAKGRWTTPKALPAPINQRGVSSKQPSISPDGRSLYFASKRKGGLGGYDIWVAHRNADGQWLSVVNLGPDINTFLDEQSPFIHFDNQTLYFASEGHPGLGNLDLYLSRRMSDTAWTPPRNLGYPINSPEADLGLIVSATGDTAYYSSDRNPRQGLDIYQFPMPDSLRPHSSSYLRGTVVEAKTHRPLPATVQLIDLKRREIVMSLRTDPQGRFLVLLPRGRRYGLFAQSAGYLDNSMHFDFKGIHTDLKPLSKTIELMPQAQGATVTLENVFFDTDSDRLRDESYVELDHWVALLKVKPTLRLEFAGHTDNTGSPAHNKDLSRRRAQSVRSYMVSKGIAKSRMEVVGHGAGKPVATNDTEEGRAKNRRTECRILGL